MRFKVHGIAFCMGKESLEKLDKVEVGYNKEVVTLLAYDGRKLEGFVYMPKIDTTMEYLPSPRYLGVLCKGARQANLDPAYIERLASRPVYTSEGREDVQAARSERERARQTLMEVNSIGDIGRFESVPIDQDEVLSSSPFGALHPS